MSAELKIGAFAKATGTSTPTIRYYEQIGLLPVPVRHEGNQRVYGQQDIRRLTFIRRCRDFGFTIEQTRALVALVRDGQRSCMEARDLAAARLVDIRQKLEELRALERSIAVFVRSCDTACVGGPGSECVMLEALASKPASSTRALLKIASPR